MAIITVFDETSYTCKDTYINLSNKEEAKMTDTFRKEYRTLSEDQKHCMERIKDKAEELLAAFEDTPGCEVDGRQMALAKTNLEQAVMWAIKAIT